jgi:hypothetical protein
VSSDRSFDHHGVRVRILNGPYLEDGKPTAQAIEYYTDLFRRLDDLRQFAADALLGLYNNSWADDDEPPIDRESFIAKLVNPAILLMDEIGSACIYFDDSGLFLGHGIEIGLEGATPTDAHLIG